MLTLQISIPKPCHEDWNKMTAREQGRFCDKCCKTVLDFSTKSPGEIQQIIREHANEKMCGRFKSDQLAKPVKLQFSFSMFGKRLSAAQVFLLALLFAFGTTLFSCTTPDDRTVGELTIDGLTPVQIVPATDTTVIMDGMVIDYEDVRESSSEKVSVNPSSKPFHDFEAQSDTPVTLPEATVSADAIPIFYGTVGLIAYKLVEESIVEDTILDSSAVTLDPNDNFASPEKETVVLYPNPAQDMVNLKLNLNDEKNVQVDLFDMSGRLLRTLIPSQPVQAEEREFQFNLGDLPPATYLIRIVAGEEVVTKRVVRN